jgi:hypothetical protein
MRGVAKSLKAVESISEKKVRYGSVVDGSARPSIVAA